MAKTMRKQHKRSGHKRSGHKRSGHKRSGHKRSGHKRNGHKRSGHKRTEKSYRKGSKSKTMKGKKDFTTKKSSKVFNRRRHYQKRAKGSRVVRKPYHKKRGGADKFGHDINEAYKKTHRLMDKVHTSNHPNKARNTASKSQVQNLNIAVGTFGFLPSNHVILTNSPMKTSKTRGISETTGSNTLGTLPLTRFFKEINKTLADYGQSPLTQPGYITLNSGSLKNISGSFYKNNPNLIWTGLKQTIKADPELRTALAKTFVSFLKPAQSMVNGKPMVLNLPNTTAYWAETLE